MNKELEETVLNIAQRQKRRQIFKRYQQKIERARELAQKHLAPEKNIKKRSYAQARMLVRKKFAGEHGANYHELGPSEKIAVDTLIDKKQAMIKKLAVRLMPKVRQAEHKRLQSFMKGAALTNISMKEDLDESFSLLIQEIEDKKIKINPAGGQPDIIQHNTFEENPKVRKAIQKKSEKSGIDEDILFEVYSRGLDSWSYTTNISKEQYAFARMNSYINKGKTYFNEDADLHEAKSLSKGISHVGKPVYDKRNGKTGSVYGSYTDGSHKILWKGDKEPIKHDWHETKQHIRIPTEKDEHKKYVKEDCNPDDPKNREVGTDSLVKIYKKSTPGQTDTKFEEEFVGEEDYDLAKTHTADFKMIKVRLPSGKIVWRKIKKSKDIVD